MLPEDPFLQLLLLVFFPLWLVAGLLDWFCHRRADIEGTTGSRESVLHLLKLGKISAAIVLGLLFEVTLALLGAMSLLLLAHQATSYADTRFSQRRRHIGPFEQQVHGFIDVLPWCALLIVAALYRADWLAQSALSFTLRAPALATHWFAVALTPLLLAGVLGLEELWRGIRRSRQPSSWLDDQFKPSPPSWIDRYLE